MEARELNRELCRLGKSLEAVNPSISKIKGLSDTLDLLLSTDKKVTEHTVNLINDAVLPLCSSPSPIVARLACQLCTQLPTANARLAQLLSTPLSKATVREVQLMHSLVLSGATSEFPLSSFLSQVTSFKLYTKEETVDIVLIRVYAEMIVDTLKKLGPTWTALVSSTIQKSFILPLLNYTYQFTPLLIDLFESLPGLCLSPKLVADLFENPMTDLPVLAGCLRAVERCGLQSVKAFGREVVSWLVPVLRRALRQILSGSSAECAGGVAAVAALADAGWLARLGSEEQKQLVATCVGAVRMCPLSAAVKEEFFSRFDIIRAEPLKRTAVAAYSEAASVSESPAEPVMPELKRRKLETAVAPVQLPTEVVHEVVLPVEECGSEDEDGCPSLQLNSPSPTNSCT